jgi:hypothetical protein
MINKENWPTNEIKMEFERNDTDSHKKMKPFLEAFMYFPTNQEIIEFDERNPNASNRKIFEGSVQYNFFEETKLKELKEAIEKFNKKQAKSCSPKLSPLKDGEMLRFLQASYFDITKTLEMITNHIEWKKTIAFQKVSDKTIEILNIGLIYIHGRDCRFRPIINISAKTFEKYKNIYSFSEIEMAFIYLMEYILENLLIPGQVENWDVIIDCKDVYITSIPAELQSIISHLQNNYPCRLFILYIVNISANLDFLWGSIKPLLDGVTGKKFKLLKSSTTKEIFTYINPFHIERKLGGKAADLNQRFFPGYVPGHDSILEGEKKSNILLDFESYKKLVKSKTKIAHCPYLDTIPEFVESDADDESDKDSSENESKIGKL